MLLAGFNHVAVLTSDTDRLHDFYREAFDTIRERLIARGGRRRALTRDAPLRPRPAWAAAARR